MTKETLIPISAFTKHLEEFKASLEESYSYKIKNLETRNASLETFVRWGWALAKDCEHRRSKQACSKTGGACRPGVCPLI